MTVLDPAGTSMYRLTVPSSTLAPTSKTLTSLAVPVNISVLFGVGSKTMFVEVAASASKLVLSLAKLALMLENAGKSVGSELEDTKLGTGQFVVGQPCGGKTAVFVPPYTPMLPEPLIPSVPLTSLSTARTTLFDR